jgi:hypothetical protein
VTKTLTLKGKLNKKRKEIIIMTKYVKIRGEVFPYKNSQWSDTFIGITGKHLFVNMLPTEVPERYAVKLSGLVNIQDLAEAKVLREYPELDTWTAYGTRPKGYWALVKAQMRKTLYWAINKQPKSLTIFTNVVSGLDSTSTESYTVYGLTQLCMQLGVTTQIVMPDTGYVCQVEPVCNKKELPVFTGQFICEKLYQAAKDGTLPEEFQDQTKEIEAKCKRLQAYRKEVQDSIWEQINVRLSEYRDEWKAENLYTLSTRSAYAIDKQVEDILLAYRVSFQIPARDAITLKDLLLDQELQHRITTTVGRYAAAFGLEVRVTERVPNFGTYTPKHWLRDDKGTLTEAVLLRRALKQQQNMQPAPLNELLTAYVQIDYYLSLPDYREFLAEGYSVCACGDILNKRDECCPICGSVNPNYEPQTVPYDTVRDCAMNNWSDYLEE